MVQEDLGLSAKVSSLEARIKDLERLLKFGLVGGTADDLQSQVTRHQILLGAIIGDRTLGNVLLGPFPSGISSTGFRRADGDLYPVGSLNMLGSTSSQSVINNAIFAMPFYMPDLPNVIDTVVLQVLTAEAGKNARIAIYEEDGNIYPGKLLFDVGEVSVASTGLKAITLSESVSRGLMWAAFNTNSPNGVFKTYAVPDIGTWVILGQNPTSLVEYVGWRVTSTYGPFPDMYPANATKVAECPLMFVGFKPGGYS
ncbi:hypothetical protein LCGC14_1706890 [marine sediment metagenome]|uniref:Uncharacterized protein n=1 Tax=marine sediment metagenome TaxID=412755 RepID=A0A0F9I3Z1_9ZZZZ